MIEGEKLILRAGVKLSPTSSWWVTYLLEKLGKGKKWMTVGKTIYYSSSVVGPLNDTNQIKKQLEKVSDYEYNFLSDLKFFLSEVFGG